jgi:hypothetical protein
MIEVVSDATRRPNVVRDVVSLIDREVDAKSGLGGMAIKAGYKVVKTLKNGQMIPDVVDGLLDEFSGAIEPLHARYRESGSGSFEAFLASNEREAVGALLSITDQRARTTSHTTLKKTYEKLRPVGEKNVAMALPAIGRLVDQYCG